MILSLDMRAGTARSRAAVVVALLFVVVLAAGAVATAAGAEPMPLSSFMPLGAPTFAPKGYIQFCVRRPDQCDLPAPMPDQDRRSVEKMLNRRQWAYLFNLRPMSITPPPNPASLETSFHEDDGLTLAAPELPPVEAVVLPPPLLPAAPAPIPTEAGPRAIELDPYNWAALNRINRTINASIRPMTDEAAFGVSDYWTLPLTDAPRPVGNCKHYVLEKRKALVDAGVPSDALSIAIVRTEAGEIHAVLIIATDRGDLVLDSLSQQIKGWREPAYVWLSRQVPGRTLDWATIAVEWNGRRLPMPAA